VKGLPGFRLSEGVEQEREARVERFIRKAKETIDTHRMLNRGDRVVVGVSGGADSVALLHALLRLQEYYRVEINVAHVNHGLRGAESEREATFVEDMARNLNLPFRGGSFDVCALAKREQRSHQEAARRVRYTFFTECLKGWGGNKVALGHNANDQAETIVMRLLRGAGIRGLSGIAPVRDGIFIRPLLEVSREEIEGFLKSNHIPYCHDSSNDTTDYLRNRVRKELMPALLKLNPNLLTTLSHTGSALRAEDQYLEGQSKMLMIRKSSGACCGEVSFPIAWLLELPQALRVRLLRMGFAAVAGGLEHMESSHVRSLAQVLELKKPFKRLQLPQGIVAERRYESLVLKKAEDDPVPFSYRFESLPCRVRIDEIGEEIHFELMGVSEGIDFKKSKLVAYVDYDRVDFPLVIRSLQAGDWFRPFGMEGKKKVKDFLIDEKVVLPLRKRVPLVVFNGRIIWVGGLRADTRAGVTQATRKILRLELRKATETCQAEPNFIVA
jgi:tRNA(Ile)-lysidine synthase